MRIKLLLRLFEVVAMERVTRVYTFNNVSKKLSILQKMQEKQYWQIAIFKLANKTDTYSSNNMQIIVLML